MMRRAVNLLRTGNRFRYAGDTPPLIRQIGKLSGEDYLKEVVVEQEANLQEAYSKQNLKSTFCNLTEIEFAIMHLTTPNEYKHMVCKEVEVTPLKVVPSKEKEKKKDLFVFIGPRRFEKGFYTVSVDASYNPNTKIATLGAIVRNDSGELISFQREVVEGVKTVTEAEIKAIVFGLELVYSKYTNVVVESDCQSAVLMINGYTYTTDEEYLELYSYIWDTLSSFEHGKVKYIVRECNKAADRLVSPKVCSAVGETILKYTRRDLESQRICYRHVKG